MFNQLTDQFPKIITAVSSSNSNNSGFIQLKNQIMNWGLFYMNIHNLFSTGPFIFTLFLGQGSPLFPLNNLNCPHPFESEWHKKRTFSARERKRTNGQETLRSWLWIIMSSNFIIIKLRNIKLVRLRSDPGRKSRLVSI